MDYLAKKEIIESELRNNQDKGEWVAEKINNPNYK
jgi:hypothetical protein